MATYLPFDVQSRILMDLAGKLRLLGYKINTYGTLRCALPEILDTMGEYTPVTVIREISTFECLRTELPKLLRKVLVDTLDIDENVIACCQNVSEVKIKISQEFENKDLLPQWQQILESDNQMIINWLTNPNISLTFGNNTDLDTILWIICYTTLVPLENNMFLQILLNRGCNIFVKKCG